MTWEQEASAVVSEWFSDLSADTETFVGYHLLDLGKTAGAQAQEAAAELGWNARQRWTGSEWEVEVYSRRSITIESLLDDGRMLDEIVAGLGGRWIFSWIGDT